MNKRIIEIITLASILVVGYLATIYQLTI